MKRWVLETNKSGDPYSLLNMSSLMFCKNIHVSTGHLTCQQKTQRGPWPCRRYVSSFSSRVQPREIGFWFWLYKTKTWPAKAMKKKTFDDYFSWGNKFTVRGVVCYLLWDEHKEQYSLYFSIYRAPSLAGLYHRGNAGGEGKENAGFPNTPSSWRSPVSSNLPAMLAEGEPALSV